MNIQFPTDFYLLSCSPFAVRHVEQSVDDRAEQCRPSISSGREIKSFLPVIYDRSNVFYLNSRQKDGPFVRDDIFFSSSFLSSFYILCSSVGGFCAWHRYDRLLASSEIFSESNVLAVPSWAVLDILVF